MILKFHCKCGANSADDAIHYDGHVGYEAVICKKCGHYYDHEGVHEPDDFSLSIAGITPMLKALRPGMVYDIYSPDGFAIHPIDTYPTVQSANEAFAKWKDGYRRQGYYSSNHGRISLDQLRSNCIFKQNKSGTKILFVDKATCF